MDTGIKVEVKTKPFDIITPLKDEPVDDDEYVVPPKRFRRNQDVAMTRNCPFLDTIDRSVLDFDFEKLCSVSLSNINVYACLVCGKYFQGRGQHSHAYTHSVQVGHHVFINLHTLKFYCLPDNYEIIDPSLEDIKYVLRPTFTVAQIATLDTSPRVYLALDGTKYVPGIVGLNVIKANDYMNVILQALAQVSPFRDFFLREENYAHVKPPPGDQNIVVVQRLGELCRKLWNQRSFKAHVSPHEMLQAVSSVSKKRFMITKQGDPVEFLSWLLNTLHIGVGGSKKSGSTVVHQVFQGALRIFTKTIPAHDDDVIIDTSKYKEEVTESPFLYITLDLPPPPLFQDDMEKNIIPQVALFDLLKKFDGMTEKEYKTHRESFIKRFEITKLPPYLILFIKRFTKNNFYIEKNPTIVNFPIQDIDMAEFLSSDPAVQDAHPHTSYDLLANICHDGPAEAGKGTYRVHLRHKGTNQWFELQDLHVTELLPQMITLAEAYIQIWELKRDNDVGNNEDMSTTDHNS